jgi:hypothetical protein
MCDLTKLAKISHVVGGGVVRTDGITPAESTSYMASLIWMLGGVTVAQGILVPFV